MEKAFTKPYENGWDAKPASNSWVTPEIMNAYDSAIDEIDNRVIAQNEDLTQNKDSGFLQGRNIWNEKTIYGYIDSSGNHVSVTTQLCSADFIKVKPNTTYYLKAPYAIEMARYRADKTCIDRVSQGGNVEFTTLENEYYIKINLRTVYGTIYRNDVCINLTDSSNGVYTPSTPSNIELKENLTQMQTSTNWLVKHAKYNVTTSANGNASFTPLTKRNALILNAVAYDPNSASGHYPCIPYYYSGDRTWNGYVGCKVVDELSPNGVVAVANKNVTIHVWYIEVDNSNYTY